MEHSRLAELAKEDPERKFFSIAHLLTPQALYQAFLRLRKDASAGVDRVTYADYGKQAHQNIKELHDRLKSKTYRVQPLRRIYIPKEDGKAQRPISIPCLEDKIVQKAVVDLLTPIYEQDFLDCSYGFRPGRGAQEALDEIGRALCREPISCVLELDIQSYFDSIEREQLMEMIEGRISDASILRLIRKFINVGVIDDGRLLLSETGTGQGQVISPLLANVYLHFVLDEWIEREVKPRLRGKVFLIRYADDAVLCFQYREDAEKVLNVLPKRFAKYGLTLHPEKTRLVAFGREALASAGRAGTKPDTFDFLGFTHKCARSRRGWFTVHVKTMKKRLSRSLKRAPNGVELIATTTWTGNKPLSTRNSAAITSTTDGPRTTAACGSSIGASSGPGRSGSAGGRGEGRLPGKSTRSFCIATRFCDPGSHVPGPEQ